MISLHVLRMPLCLWWAWAADVPAKRRRLDALCRHQENLGHGVEDPLREAQLHVIGLGSLTQITIRLSHPLHAEVFRVYPSYTCFQLPSYLVVSRIFDSEAIIPSATVTRSVQSAQAAMAGEAGDAASLALPP